ncbi:bifunctional phosphoribosyl-AMP cyclohydrolase/phosphoribosyl-ATP diphosphatase HisIE [Candidatus Methanomassiliicoccus intestinalis]|jgi:histidine biosynthesis bifunctional protein hisIE|uniref:Histidine biosynthesis bifunctional protein HisIE n=2 Tax=Candidatus Methanomassiliicoccus intestinalis TaxID=1406512 RepID=R9TAS4_METII|nr:bifunctional phosphoribosyl-AMP cyclohydrolase/phosphoribosyl-ATP diphosphatase HisIE [Candidatus Methanomassiliicoccus intestinalis]AGN26776.1 bifunctional phosphoribosyl-AMP cyclohydrolase/phosphoribosyl-ATP pyrophosphatase protein [Candidatus Methanomassiliicoccus intestinalis Issoire-Mx1]TQS82897.1 MAG: bifunctional phosphoribosyl-AMP cyclohydrolase/phosphoribosyl-ATP diphosphatase [Candidatus Methanomassiliicoccus intestinalis]TQS83750.1 MAG: bifunctional phosphoribosyl-AMP cyclohydrolas
MKLTYDSNGLIPVVVQDYLTNEVLMVAWANEEAYEKMLTTGKTHFWSRSRQKLWMKGETSGNVQNIVSIQTDCDADTLLVKVKQTGNACHLDKPSCFDEVLYGSTEKTAAIIPELVRVIHDRKENPKEGSYTNALLNDEDKVLKKVIEEAGEVAIAGKGKDRDAQIWEAADLIYHQLVMYEYLGLPMDEVFGKLTRRHGGSKE